MGRKPVLAGNAATSAVEEVPRDLREPACVEPEHLLQARTEGSVRDETHDPHEGAGTMSTSVGGIEPGAGTAPAHDPDWFADLLSTGWQVCVDVEVTYSARQCRCGTAMQRTRQGPYRWYCDRCGRHER